MNDETRVVETVEKIVVREHGKLIELFVRGNKTSTPDKIMYALKGVVTVESRAFNE